ncbi:GTPase domain-containing protein [Campylobacter lari]|uniref:GTPase n=1 Tax=Campylobacter lari TaxID=201 RepID=UPI002152991E|nr:GTPase [Campylobacter lari]MCR6510794.1 50S ribosome-binding GTPase [Campylobacter lari]
MVWFLAPVAVAAGIGAYTAYKSYKNDNDIDDDISNFAKDKNVMFAGEPMAGKTTIFKIITKKIDKIDEHIATNTGKKEKYENLHFIDHGGSKAQIIDRNKSFTNLNNGDYVVYVFDSSKYNKDKNIKFGMDFWKKRIVDEEKNNGKKINYIIIGTRAGKTKKDIMNDIKQNISNAKVEIFELLGDQSDDHYKKIHKELMGLFE